MKLIVRILLVVSGVASLVLGIVGIVVPLLPTTPFLLLSAYCFARSSSKFYNWLIGNKYFGKIIDDYQKGNGIPMKIKVFALVLLWISILVVSFTILKILILQILLIAIATGVTWHILLIKKKV